MASDVLNALFLIRNEEFDRKTIESFSMNNKYYIVNEINTCGLLGFHIYLSLLLFEIHQYEEHKISTARTIKEKLKLLKIMLNLSSSPKTC